MQVLFAFEMNDESIRLLKEEVLQDLEPGPDRDFANSLIDKVLKNIESLDAAIKERVANWEMNRIALVDRVLLRMGICEILFFPDIPPKVSINEAIEISKEYSTGGSAKFINGILDAVLSEEKKSGKLNKKGRGLVEESITKNPEAK